MLLKAKTRVLAGAVLGMFLIAARVSAGDARHLAATIAPYLDGQAMVVAHVDASRIDIDATVALVRQLAPWPESKMAQLEEMSSVAKSGLEAFTKAGGRDVFAVFSLADLRSPGREPPLFVVIPVTGDGDQTTMLQEMIRGGRGGPFEKVDRVPTGGPIVAGNQATIDRLRNLQAEERRFLNTALAAMDGFSAQVVILPNDDHRRVLREMFPQLPAPLDAIDGPILADGLHWMGLGVNIDPELDAQLVIGSKDNDAARRIGAAWYQLTHAIGAEIARKMESAPPAARELRPLIEQVQKLLRPRVERDRTVITLKQEAIRPILEQVLFPALETGLKKAQRAQRMNHFKHLALAMHGWHSVKKAFPPAAICDKDGEPLLSWRVAILPYLEQTELYEQFHLDEPWDSPHNRKLVAKMPAPFEDPQFRSSVLANSPFPGHTTYVVPVGEGLVFGNREGLPIKEIKDGMSQTILIVEVTPEHAVPWTKPADWRVRQADPLDGVRRTDRPHFTAAFCDGHVRMIENEMVPEEFWKMLTRAGREQ